MKNVLKIFTSDIKALVRQFLAMAIAIAILVIPALYAWFNIYSNWDPYGNTGNIKIAIVSDDEGYTTEDGEYVNVGQEMLDGLSTSIGWTIMDSSEQAIADTEAGKYYAAIIMNEHLSRNMYNVADALSDEEPEITYYENYKMNAVANKITETAASTFHQNIQKKYIQTLLEILFGHLEEFGENFDAENSAESVIDSIRALSALCQKTGVTLDGFITTIRDLSVRLDSIDNSNLINALGTSADAFTKASLTIPQFKETLTTVTEKMVTDLDKAIAILEENPTLTEQQKQELATLLGDVKGTAEAIIKSFMPNGYSYTDGTANAGTALETIQSTADSLLQQLQDMPTTTTDSQTDTAANASDTSSAEPAAEAAASEPPAESETTAVPESAAAADTSDTAASESTATEATAVTDSSVSVETSAADESATEAVASDPAASDATTDTTGADTSDALDSLLSDLQTSAQETGHQALIKSLKVMKALMTYVVIPEIPNMFSSFNNILTAMANIASALRTTSIDLQNIFAATSDTLSNASDSLVYLYNLMVDLSKSLDKIADALENAMDSDLVSSVIDMLGGDSSMFADFLAEPVQVTTYNIYPIENYGSAMAPFYSVLAIWVGCVINMAIFKTEADPRGLKNVTSSQLYWARFLLLYLVNLLQAIIILAGDLYILGVQCLHPGLFYMVGAVTAFVFTAFIYSLCFAFGDVGKAIVVVIMVLQIAGSSGTYPIEILADVFEKFYLIFPFPYAINALRETMFGLYKLDYLKYLGELMIFGGLGLFIGLVVRKPFSKVNEFIEEDMEETGVL